MLVTINPSVGSVSTDVKTRFFNFSASLHEVATASAGSSPVVNPVNTSGVKDTNYNCITVISNTEAGGWTAGVSNNITASTTYNASFSSPYLVDLYRPTGKSTYPYYRQLFGNYIYPFSSANFSTYSQANVIQGHTSNNPAAVAYNSDTSWLNGTWSYTSDSNTNSWANSTLPNLALNCLLNSASQLQTNTIYYLAVTENYLIISDPFELLYFGIRDVSPWELTRTDNPPWCAFGFNGRASSSSSGTTNNFPRNHVLAWMSGINSTNVLSTPAKRGKQSSFSSINQTNLEIHSCTNTGGSNIPASPAWPISSWGFRPLFSLASALFSTSQSTAWPTDSPILDPSTGLSVPPVYPIIFEYNSSGSSCVGQVPGILKGMNQTAAGLTNYASATEYVVNGNPYQPILTGNPSYPDLFLLRKA